MSPPTETHLCTTIGDRRGSSGPAKSQPVKADGGATCQRRLRLTSGSKGHRHGARVAGRPAVRDRSEPLPGDGRETLRNVTVSRVKTSGG